MIKILWASWKFSLVEANALVEREAAEGTGLGSSISWVADRSRSAMVVEPTEGARV